MRVLDRMMRRPKLGPLVFGINQQGNIDNRMLESSDKILQPLMTDLIPSPMPYPYLLVFLKKQKEGSMRIIWSPGLSTSAVSRIRHTRLYVCLRLLLTNVLSHKLWI